MRLTVAQYKKFLRDINSNTDVLSFPVREIFANYDHIEDTLTQKGFIQLYTNAARRNPDHVYRDISFQGFGRNLKRIPMEKVKLVTKSRSKIKATPEFLHVLKEIWITLKEEEELKRDDVYGNEVVRISAVVKLCTNAGLKDVDSSKIRTTIQETKTNGKEIMYVEHC